MIPGGSLALAVAAVPAGPEGPTGLPGLGHLAAFAPIVAWSLYALLLLPLFVRGLGRDRAATLAALGLGALAVAVRFLVAPRVPMIGQTADFEHVNGALGWLVHGPTWGPGAYPPGGTALLYLVFGAVGPSFEVGFAVTAVLGGLTALPVFSVARRLGGTWLAGALGGLAFAVLPLAVVYANGVGLEIPAAFCLTAALAHALCWLDEERPSDAIRAALALFLLSQTRPEAVLQVPVVLAGLLGFCVGAGLAIRRGRWLGLAGAAGLALALGTPFVLLSLSAVPEHRAADVHRALRCTAAFAPGLALAAGVGARSRNWLQARSVGAWGLFAVLLGALGLWVVLATFEREGPAALAPAWRAALTVPPDWLTRSLRGASYGARVSSAFDNPWFLPIAWLPLLALSPMAARHPGSSRAAVGGVLLGLGLAVSWWAMARVALPSSGELIGDGVRYRVPISGLLGALVGLGAAGVAGFARAGWPRWSALGLLAVVVASPLVTHRGVLTDVAFDQQQRYPLLRGALERLPPATLLLAPDHLIYADVGGVPDGGKAWFSSRTPALCNVSRAILGRPEDCRGFREWAAEGRPWPGTLALLLDLDCHRTLDGREDALCRDLKAWPGLERLVDARLPNRPYDRYPLSNAPYVDVVLATVPPERVAEVTERMRRAALPVTDQGTGGAPRSSR